MNTGTRFVHGLVIGLSMFIGMASALANPSDSQAAAYSVLHNFGGTGDGFQPYYGGPALSGATLYGMTQGGGTPGISSGVLYKINTDGTGYQILHYFDNQPPDGDGTSPRGSLTLSGSTLYGCCPYGGSPYIQVGGTVFKINTDGGGYQVLYSFGGGTLNQCHPYAAPVVAGSTLYGTTSSESTGLYGEIFAMSTGGGAPQVLHEFGGKPDDGAAPYGSLTLVGSRLYGMTSTGGSGGISGGGSGYGVIFAIDTDGNNYQVLHHFQGYPDDGNNPYGSLTLVGSKLYGMTSSGGTSNGPGVIFSINLDGGGYQVLFDFASASIGGPYGSLTPWGGKLYGMTSGGGPGGASGVIFRVNPDGTRFQILHGFMPSQGDGGDPLGDLTLSGSRLYGWTYTNGSYNAGVVFSFQTPQSDPAMLQLLLLD
jgi:uncharacterized repeat protein (TIGR03803 family)